MKTFESGHLKNDPSLNLHFYLFLTVLSAVCVRPTTFGHHQPSSPYDPTSTLNPALLQSFHADKEMDNRTLHDELLL